MVRVGINGFGRIGRCVARYILDERNDLEIVKINASGDFNSNSHLLHFDSIHGRWKGQLSDNIIWSHTRLIDAIDWSGVDVVLECTGAFNDGEVVKTHIDNGAKKVLISAPAKNVDFTTVYGVNHHDITEDDRIISNASCTTNCLAPLASVLHKEFGIKRGVMTTVHSYTGDQSTVDRRHKDPYRARTAGMSMIPTSTGATKNIGLIIPELAGKLTGSAIRVPTANVSCVDFTFETEKSTSVEEINLAFKSYSNLFMNGVLGYETQPLVSIDYNHTSESCIIAADQTKVIDNHMGRVLAWYDNEWAFSCRMADTASYIGNL
jgi:glyceraldehyde 3-phosphate dehydrogenase